MHRYSLAEQAAQELLARIARGDWRVGDRLPGETVLASELDVGRSTVREAVRELAGRGVLDSRQGAGVFVRATEPTEDWQAMLRRARIADVVEGRIAVEVEAARLAAIRRTPNDLRTLRRRLTERAAAADNTAYVEADLRFHHAVVAAAHNPVIAELFTTFAPRIRQAMLDLLDDRQRESDQQDTQGAHRAIAEAIRDRDPDRAAAVSRSHLNTLLG